MGNDLRHKGLLLDEADFALPQDCDMATLIQAVEAFCKAEFRNEFDHPSLEFFGVVSERLEDTSANPFDSFLKAAWVKPETSFQDIFLKTAEDLGIPEPLAIEAIETGHTESIETQFKDRIRAHLDARDYYSADRLMQYLPDLLSIGLPGVKGADEFDTRGQDMIVDFRVNTYGTGRRILVEIAFNWGQ